MDTYDLEVDMIHTPNFENAKKILEKFGAVWGMSLGRNEFIDTKSYIRLNKPCHYKLKERIISARLETLFLGTITIL